MHQVLCNSFSLHEALGSLCDLKTSISSSLLWMVVEASLAAAATFFPAVNNHFWPLSSHSFALSFPPGPAACQLLLPSSLLCAWRTQIWHQQDLRMSTGKYGSTTLFAYKCTVNIPAIWMPSQSFPSPGTAVVRLAPFSLQT